MAASDPRDTSDDATTKPQGASTNGAGTHDEDPEAHGDPEGGFGLALPPLEPPPPEVAELVAACSRFVASKYHVALDGTLDTLSLIDQYVRDARQAVAERPEALELLAPSIGAYLGEVLRTQFGAEWRTDGPHAAWRICFSRVFLTVNPVGIALEALTMRDAEGFHAHLEVDPGESELVSARLEAMPQVDEEEYYLPTTRIDVVAAIVELLLARAEATGTSDVTFTLDDYDD